jgi:DNA-binding NtrC family response regulator
MPERILAVDDEPDMLKVLSMIIREKTPYELITTNNPLEALEIVRKGNIDMVIADLKMPGLDGSELLEAVRAHNAEIPVIIMTAFATEEAASEIIAKGGFDFIIKPFRKEQIITAIERGLKWSQMQHENRMLRERLEKEGL